MLYRRFGQFTLAMMIIAAFAAGCGGGKGPALMELDSGSVPPQGGPAPAGALHL